MDKVTTKQCSLGSVGIRQSVWDCAYEFLPGFRMHSYYIRSPLIMTIEARNPFPSGFNVYAHKERRFGRDCRGGVAGARRPYGRASVGALRAPPRPPRAPAQAHPPPSISTAEGLDARQGYPSVFVFWTWRESGDGVEILKIAKIARKTPKEGKRDTGVLDTFSKETLIHCVIHLKVINPRGITRAISHIYYQNWEMTCGKSIHLYSSLLNRHLTLSREATGSILGEQKYINADFQLRRRF